ncbi:MAG: hypothetical protein ACYC7E_18300 [Armatimonadota bacterium]
MHVVRHLFLAMAVAGAIVAHGAPYIGYVYPSGGQRGTVARIKVGGSRLTGCNGAIISGAGVSVTFVSYEASYGPLNYIQRDFLRRKIDELIKKLQPPPKPATPPPATTPPTTPMPKPPDVKLPDFPELRDLEKKTIPELRKILVTYVYKRKTTRAPIAEDVTLDITIAPNAPVGNRTIRVITNTGLSNPMFFQVTGFPEIREKDLDDEKAVAPPPMPSPVVVNGQIMPGEVDRFVLKLRSGQRLTFTAYARYLVPFLADAVPGWFQATLTLTDAVGKEVGYASDTGLEQDPTMFVHVPRDGEYTLAVRDCIYRGREDFVYRVIIRDQLPTDTVYPLADIVRAPRQGPFVNLNPRLPWVDNQLPLGADAGSNNTANTAQKITLPLLIKGSISQPGDIDVYQFTGTAGATVVAEVYARRLGSPMDSLLRISDTAGHVLAWNDDNLTGDMVLNTHRADSYLSVKLPFDGAYLIHVSDAQRHSGGVYRYYLRIGPPQADFILRMVPASLSMPAGRTISFTVYATRQDGWDGDIAILLTDPTEGYTLSGGKIPKGKNSASMALKAPVKKIGKPLLLSLEGRATIDGKILVRPVVPVERLMQAFSYYHLVPASELMVYDGVH